MIKVTNTWLNVRIGAPDTSAPCRSYLTPGTTIDVTDTVAGTMIDGNNIWLKDASNNYYWSGGFENNSFSERLIYHLRAEPLAHFMSREDIARLESIKGIEGIGWTIDKEQCYVSLFYSGKDQANLPTWLTIQMDSAFYRLPIRVRNTASFSIHTALQPSDRVKNHLPLVGTDDKVNSGSMCYFVKLKDDTQTYAITCFHVARSDWNAFDMDTPDAQDFQVLKDEDNSSIGSVIDGMIDEDVDAALIALDPRIMPDPRIPALGMVSGTRDITCLDIKNKLPVFMFGATSFLQSGQCTDIMKKVTLNYGFESRTLQNLIVVQNNGKAISTGGDSGSLVVDSRNAAIGMIVGGTDTHTLLIPINRVLSKFKATF